MLCAKYLACIPEKCSSLFFQHLKLQFVRTPIALATATSKSSDIPLGEPFTARSRWKSVRSMREAKIVSSMWCSGGQLELGEY